MGFGTRDDGVKIPVYILWIRIRYFISMTLFNIGNSTTRMVTNKFVSKTVTAKLLYLFVPRLGNALNKTAFGFMGTIPSVSHCFQVCK